MKVYVIGLGLIGGSLSKDIKDAFKDAVVYGFDKNPENVKKALEIGFIDHAFEMQDLSQAEVVIVAIPVDAQQKVLPQVLDRIGDDTLVFDAGSTKEKSCKLVANHPKRRNFLATHPIAGTEFSGPEAAINGLFQNKTNIICEVEKNGFQIARKRIGNFLEELGCVSGIWILWLTTNILPMCHIYRTSVPLCWAKRLLTKSKTSVIFLIWRAVVLNRPCDWQKVRLRCGRQFLKRTKKTYWKPSKNTFRTWSISKN